MSKKKSDLKYTKSDILIWLACYDKSGELRKKLINKINEVVEFVVEKYGIQKFNNNQNSFSDVFDLVFAYVKIEIAPSDTKDVQDYTTIMERSYDLPLAVWFKTMEMFEFPTYTDADDRYCNNTMYFYISRDSFFKYQRTMLNR